MPGNTTPRGTQTTHASYHTHRKLSPFNAFGMNFCVVCYLFVIMGESTYTYGGWGVLVWTWLAASVGTCCIACSLAETASACPVNSGLYYYAARLAPRRFRPLASYATAYMSLLGSLASVAITAGFIIPFLGLVVFMLSMDENGLNAYVLTGWQGTGIYCGIIMFSLFINSFSLTVTCGLITFVTLWNLVVLVALLGTLLVVATHHQPASFVFAQPFAAHEDVTGIASLPWTTLLAISVPANALYGYDAIIFMSEETTRASHTVPRAIVSAAACAAGMSWILVVAFGFCVQNQEALLDPLAAAGGYNVWLQVMFDVFQGRYGDGRGGVLLSVLVLVPAVLGVSLWGTGVTRKLHCMSRDGLVPGSAWLAQIDARTHTPLRCVWACHAVVLLFAVAMPFYNSAIFFMVVAFSTLATYTSYFLPIVLRLTAPAHAQPAPGSFDLGPRWRPWVSGFAVLYIVCGAAGMVLPYSRPVTWRNMNYTGPAYGLLLLLLAAAYFAPARIGGVRHWWRGPGAGKIAGIAYALWDE